MVCDWYQATIPDYYQNLVMHLENNFSGKWKIAETGQMGYKNRWWFNDENDITVATILFGSANAKQQKPHIYSTSDNAKIVRDLLRSAYPIHEVTRIDVAEDMNRDGLFDELQVRLLKIAHQERLKTSVAGDWLSDGALGGRTMYLGSPKSSMRVRLYEKGKQLANDLYISRGFQPPDDFPMNWVRLEAQCRPKREQRFLAAKADLADIWGFSGWTRVVADDVLSLSVPRVKADVWRKSDDVQVWEWVSRQYGNFFMKNFNSLGSWENVGLKLGFYVDKYMNSKLNN